MRTLTLLNFQVDSLSKTDILKSYSTRITQNVLFEKKDYHSSEYVHIVSVNI